MNSYHDSQITDLIARCRARDDQAFAELLERYTPMIRRVIRGFFDSGINNDELFAEACAALHSAAMKYDLGQTDVTFGLYASICIHHAIVDLIRRESRGRGVVRLDADEIGTSDGIEAGLVLRETARELLTVAEKILSQYEYRVLLLHIRGYKTSDIARELGRTPKSVDNAKARMLRCLRRELGDISVF